MYNSGRDIKQTEVKKIDSVVYGTSNASIGTVVYYKELAQNVDTTRFPFGWNQPVQGILRNSTGEEMNPPVGDQTGDSATVDVVSDDEPVDVQNDEPVVMPEVPELEEQKEQSGATSPEFSHVDESDPVSSSDTRKIDVPREDSMPSGAETGDVGAGMEPSDQPKKSAVSTDDVEDAGNQKSAMDQADAHAEVAAQATERWDAPKAVAFPSSYILRPSIVENTTRREVQPQSVEKNRDGSYTVIFEKEILGDIQLTASAPKKTGIRITLGEEISGGKAVAPMRTGNRYDETWSFQGDTVTYTGTSLKGFRYVTIYGYPGSLTESEISGIQTGVVDGGETASFSSDQQLLNQIFDLTNYSYQATAADTISDSITRERRPYEGDNLVTQDLAYSVSEDYLTARNTWNYLLANPTQYTEYRLMSAIGIRQDYLQTGDAKYLSQVYDQVKDLVSGAVTCDSSLALVSGSSGLVDLVDWPRSEVSDFDFASTRYKAAINIFAYATYDSLAQIAEVTGHALDASFYSSRAETIKQSVLSRFYDPRTKAFRNGLTATGSPVSSYSIQNTYFALAYVLFRSDQSQCHYHSRSMDNRVQIEHDVVASMGLRWWCRIAARTSLHYPAGTGISELSIDSPADGNRDDGH